MDDLTRAYLTLKCAKGLGPRKAKILLEALGSAVEVINITSSDLLRVDSVGPALVKAIEAAKASDWPTKEWERAQKLGVDIIHPEHAGYPESLKAIFDPPLLLYVRGKLPDLPGAAPKSFGIVGTRNASDYALRLTKQLSQELAGQGIAIISGLALGVDSAAHEGAVAVESGQTVAVLGSGVDIIYPRQNQTLAKKIVEGHGAVMSEYALGTRPHARNFPGRNRIITGMSKGILVVEAGEKSGALITADYAAEEGRQVFAVPGRVGDPRSRGTLKLLKQGAMLVQETNDILEEMNWQANVKTQPKPAVVLSTQDAALVDLIERLETPLLDDLIAASEQTAAQLLPQLMQLELKGLIRTLPGSRYTRA